ncbi:MAG: glycine cleavage system aminomethyltransferase GcvT [Rhizobiales bacterium]|nr:glycine cleavage system aminomethyltransferase GcvT [Hyphomicrobiales bacterium]NRB13514.1 glycine cleavage system aminomethyltransferase GcvT [Hyphomicrobiales bacterium]
MSDNLKTALFDLHVKLGAKIVPFAGYDMPVQYPLGVLAEHNHTRQNAGLFDVSHMGQAVLTAANADVNIAEAFEKLVPASLINLAENRTRYSLLMADNGCILDDLMITRLGEDENGCQRLYLVVNAGCKHVDFEHIGQQLSGIATLEILDRALIALQGPKAAQILALHVPQVATQPFMSISHVDFDGTDLVIARCGYTGEDGFEISIANDQAIEFANLLLEHDEVEAIGLGARDSLRLEVGLCLYGHDIDTTTNPVEADLLWAINKRRRQEGGFIGADIVLQQIEQGANRKRVGILPEGRAPAREHTEIYSKSGQKIGEITSGGFGPTFGGPIAMGYVDIEFTSIGTEVDLMVRGKARPAKIAAMPFVPQNYYKP